MECAFASQQMLVALSRFVGETDSCSLLYKRLDLSLLQKSCLKLDPTEKPFDEPLVYTYVHCDCSQLLKPLYKGGGNLKPKEKDQTFSM